MSDKNSELGEIIDSVNIEYWLNREGIEYKIARGKRGIQLNVRECPACGNDKWKVYLNQDTGLGNCFHGDCEAKFSKWSFIQAHLHGVSNYDVVQHIKAVAVEQGYQPKIRSEYKAPSLGTLSFPASIPLPFNGSNLKYLNQRGIDKEIASEFKLRFCKTGYFEYIDTDGQKKRQHYDNRVIIPIYDLDGKLASYQGRDITGTSEKKYLFPSGFASTGSIIYNGQNAYGAVEVCMGEGVFDVMAIHKAFRDDVALCNVIAVGSFGKHLSKGDENSQLAQIIKLKEAGLKRITIMWDGEDRALQDAANAALDLRSIGLIVRIAVLPKDKDPNEVEPDVVRQAFLDAKEINSSMEVKFKLGIFR
ncbi:toprim domain-containing protein [Acinetobacter brisouii]|uniref:toprim domain-containing protein n=1 Tax=Acinetobacter brisouii TaxID=396323 RepID=UPI00208E9AF2|nr:toprim domain-containing protein [Acinetobacter brisouii]